VFRNAVHVMRIATGEIEDTIEAPDPANAPGLARLHSTGIAQQCGPVGV